MLTVAVLVDLSIMKTGAVEIYSPLANLLLEHYISENVGLMIFFTLKKNPL